MSPLIYAAVREGLAYAKAKGHNEEETIRAIANFVAIAITQEFIAEIPRAKNPEQLDRLRKKILGDPV